MLGKSGTAGSLAGMGDRDALAAVGNFLSGAAAIGTSDVEPAQASCSAFLISDLAAGPSALHQYILPDAHGDVDVSCLFLVMLFQPPAAIFLCCRTLGLGVQRAEKLKLCCSMAYTMRLSSCANGLVDSRRCAAAAAT